MTTIKELSLSEIKARLNTELIGREFWLLGEVDSTNESAKRLASRVVKEGFVVAAERQRLGRGRLGRRWHSPEGGLWFSVILRPDMDASEAPKLTLTAAVAVANAIQESIGLKVEVKWPNDLIIRGRKVCGILTEAVLEGSAINFIVLGIGINVNIYRETLPRDVEERIITLREASGREVDRCELLCCCLKQLEVYYDMLRGGGFSSILEEWRGLALFLGEEVEVRGLNKRLCGIAMDVNEDGALILELADGDSRRVLSGDVSLRSSRIFSETNLRALE